MVYPSRTEEIRRELVCFSLTWWSAPGPTTGHRTQNWKGPFIIKESKHSKLHTEEGNSQKTTPIEKKSAEYLLDLAY